MWVLIPGWGRSPGVGSGIPLQYSCLENSMARGTGRPQSWRHKELDTTEHSLLLFFPLTLQLMGRSSAFNGKMQQLELLSSAWEQISPQTDVRLGNGTKNLIQNCDLLRGIHQGGRVDFLLYSVLAIFVQVLSEGKKKPLLEKVKYWACSIHDSKFTSVHC